MTGPGTCDPWTRVKGVHGIGEIRKCAGDGLSCHYGEYVIEGERVFWVGSLRVRGYMGRWTGTNSDEGTGSVVAEVVLGTTRSSRLFVEDTGIVVGAMEEVS